MRWSIVPAHSQRRCPLLEFASNLNPPTSSVPVAVAADGRTSTAGFSTREVAEWIGLKPAQVRHYVRRQLVQPARSERGRYRFSFQDVVVLRTAKELIAARITPRRANRALLKLSNTLEAAQSLTSVKVQAAGMDVVVREDDRLWSAETGQGHLNFDASEPAKGANNVAALNQAQLIVVSETNEPDTDTWYNMGLDLEELEPERAPDAYRQAIDLDPNNADAHVNLGRLCQIKGDLRSAKRHYELALTIVPGHQLASYNLGTVFDELEELERAAQYYQAALDVPDSHYNLARISELRGDELAARRYMQSYRSMLDESDS